MIIIAAYAASLDVAVHWTHPFVFLFYCIYVSKRQKGDMFFKKIPNYPWAKLPNPIVYKAPDKRYLGR